MELPGNSKLDYHIISELAEALGRGAYFQYAGIEEVFRELAVATAGGKADYSGITYERLRGERASSGLVHLLTIQEHRNYSKIVSIMRMVKPNCSAFSLKCQQSP